MKRRFLRHVAVLVLGSGLAQAIALVFAPLLTRLYSPDDYAAITMFLTLVGVLLPFACGKYEVAIVVAGTDRHASALTALSCVIALLGAVALFVPTVLAWGWINTALGCPELGRWLMAVPLALLIGAIAMVGRHVANRRSAFPLISQYLVAQAIASVGLNVLLGWLGWGANGLVAANLISVGAGTGLLLWRLRDDLSSAGRTDARALGRVAHKYRDFPIFSASSTVLDALTQAMPVFFIARTMSQETLGHYGMMMRIAQAPLSAMGGAVTQVHLKHLSDLVRAGTPATPYLRRITLALAAAAAPPTFVALLWAPDLFAWVFGAPWRRAGELLAILMPSIAVQFIASVLSPACGATGHNRLGAIWKALAFGVTLTMFCVTPADDGSDGPFFALSAVNVALYATYYGFIWFAVKHPRGQA